MPDEIAESQKSEYHEQTEDASTAPNHGRRDRLKDQRPEPMPKPAAPPDELVPGVVVVSDDSDVGGPISITIVETTE
ncbi:MAG TPA: hypothetical protein VK324_15200 [Tepidisphaeraceae bacterium]|nr:hypothetical protein [Tepidisphaeraceae bacterium]